MADSSISKVSDLSNLMSKFFPSDKKTDKLNKNLENLNKTILALAKTRVQGTVLGGEIATLAKTRVQYNTFAEALKERLFGQRSLKDKYGSIRSALDTFNIVKKNTGGVFDQMLARREEKQQYIRDQLLVNPQMKDTSENRAAFARKFETQQKIQKQLRAAQAEIDRLQSNGYTETQIARTGLVKKRDTLASQLVASDNRLYDKVRDKDVVMQNAREDSTEATKKQDETLSVQKNILAGILDIKELLGGKKSEPVEQTKQSGWLSGLLGTISGFLLSKVGAIAGLLKGSLLAIMKPLETIVSGLKNLIMGAGKKIVDAGKSAIKRGAGAIKNIKPLTYAKGVTGAGLLMYAPDLNVNEDQEVADIQERMKNGETIEFGGDGPKTAAEFEAKKQQDKKLNTAKANKDLSRFTPFGKTNDSLFIPSKPAIDSIGDKISEKIINNNQMKSTSKDSQTIVAPSTTTNNTTATTNILGKFSPRNPEPSQGRYVLKAFTL